MPRDYDSAYKAFYERLFQRWEVPVETQVEVSRRARSIDVVMLCEEEHQIRLRGTAFEFVRRVNALELKSPGDPFNLPDYMLTTSRVYGLLAKQATEENQLPTNATLTILCSVRPQKILDDLQDELRFFPTSEPGVYLSDQQIETRIIVATELEVVEKNYPLLILAKGEKLLEFFEEVVRKGLTEYIEILFQVGVETDPETLIKGVRKMAEMNPEAYAKWERSVANLFDAMKTHEPFRTAVKESERKAVEEAVEERERNAMIQAKQKTLSLLLESKFGQLPQELALKIESLSDVEELDRLCQGVLHAQTLDEVGFEKE